MKDQNRASRMKRNSLKRILTSAVVLVLLASLGIAAVRSDGWSIISTHLSDTIKAIKGTSEQAKPSVKPRTGASATASNSSAVMPMFAAGTTDFHQAANDDNSPHTISWINGILNKNNSRYYEGTSTLQRLVYTGIAATNGNVHTLTFSHHAMKGTAHAYDYLTSWKQAVDAANAIAPGQNLLSNLNPCGSALSAAGLNACNSLHSSIGPLDPPNGTTVVDVDLPDAMGSVLGDDVAASVAGYENRFGNRTIRIYGNQNITNASLVFNGYVADDATYTLTWISASGQILIEFAGHISQGTDTLGAGIGYGPGKGASSINGGPYHILLGDFDGSGGSLDNQIQGSDVCDIAASASVTSVSCFGGSNGAINLTVTGGTAPITFQWNDGNTSQNRTGLTAGTYSVLVTEKNGCTAMLSNLVVGQPAAALSAGAVGTNALCFGGNGSVDLTVSGGTLPYSYAWSNNATTEDLTGVPAGSYSVTVTDAKGCTTTANAEVRQPAELSLSESHTNVSCNNGTNGAINLMVSGGTSPYTIAWSNGATSEDLSGIAAGTYSVTVTDVNNCTARLENIQITQPAALVLSETHTDVSCFAGSDGSIDLTVSGGTAPYTIAWNNNSTTEDLNGLTAGTYSVTVTDTNGCTASTSVTITQPAEALGLTELHTNVSCFGGNNGSIDLSVTGGTVPYSYSWSNGTTSEDLSTLVAGTYSVTVTDAKGCTTNTSVTITQPAEALSLGETHTNVKCNAGTDGGIALTVSGGTAPFTYLWNSGATSEDLKDIPAGTYSVKVTDANGCTAELKDVQITQPDPLDPKVTADGDTSFCAGGEVVLKATDGFASYQWCKDGNDISGATSASYTAKESGDYLVKVTNAEGCKGTSAPTTVTVNPLPDIKVSGEQKLTCVVSMVELSSDASNIANPKFAWTTGDGHFVDGTDTSSNKVKVDRAGTYTVTVTDMDTGCSASKEIKVTEDKTPPNAEAGTAVSLSCLTGQATLKGSSTTSNVQYLWETSDGNIVSGADTASPVVDKPGTYKLTVTSSDNGCTATDTVKVNPCLSAYCTLTQGAYGNTNGKYWYNGQQYVTQALIEALLTPAPLVIGKPGRSVTIPLAAAKCIRDRLPSGGPAAILPAVNDATMNSTSCQTPVTLPVDSKGKWRNILLGQTVTLSLNVRLDSKLGGLKLCGTTIVTQKAKDGGDGIIGINPATNTSDDIPDPGADGVYGPNPNNLDLNGNPINDDPLLTVTIPQSVLDALSSLGLSSDVNGLLELANRALAVSSTGGASLSSINAAVDAINRGFDECRFLISPSCN